MHFRRGHVLPGASGDRLKHRHLLVRRIGDQVAEQRLIPIPGRRIPFARSRRRALMGAGRPHVRSRLGERVSRRLSGQADHVRLDFFEQVLAHGYVDDLEVRTWECHATEISRFRTK